jgi:hypothetical protein
MKLSEVEERGEGAASSRLSRWRTSMEYLFNSPNLVENFPQGPVQQRGQALAENQQTNLFNHIHFYDTIVSCILCYSQTSKRKPYHALPN